MSDDVTGGKGQGAPVAQPGVGHMPAPCEDAQKAARVFFVAAAWAPQRLVIGLGMGSLKTFDHLNDWQF